MNKNVSIIYIILIVTLVTISGCVDSDRPTTGTILKHTMYNGEGTLTVKNGLSDDIVAILAVSNDPKVSTLSVYIRSHDSYTISNISDNNYVLYYKVGDYWNKDSGKFAVTKGNSRFKNDIIFTAGSNSSATLNILQGDNTGIKYVYEEDLPK